MAAAIRQCVFLLCCGLAGAALAQNPCGDCRNDALTQHKACNAAAKDAPASQACGEKMSDLMQVFICKQAARE